MISISDEELKQEYQFFYSNMQNQDQNTNSQGGPTFAGFANHSISKNLCIAIDGKNPAIAVFFPSVL